MSLNYAAQASQLVGTDVNLLHTVTRRLLFMSTVELEVDKIVGLFCHFVYCSCYGNTINRYPCASSGYNSKMKLSVERQIRVVGLFS